MRSRLVEEREKKERLLLGVVATEDLELEQLDVKIAFFHEDLDEDIYMKQLPSFKTLGLISNIVCIFWKSIYENK